MKKTKVTMQFVCELFIITFTAIIIGTGIGATVSVPVTNALLESQIAEIQESNEEVAQNYGMGGRGNGQSFMKGGNFANPQSAQSVNYIDSVSSATDFTMNQKSERKQHEQVQKIIWQHTDFRHRTDVSKDSRFFTDKNLHSRPHP